MELVIGLLGKTMAGKGTFTKCLSSLLEPAQVASLRRTSGESDSSLKSRIEDCPHPVVILEIHKPDDIEVARGFQEHIIVDILASPITRWGRSRLVHNYPEFGELGYSRFLLREATAVETELDEYRHILRYTIINIANHTSKEEFCSVVKEEIFNTWVLPRMNS